MKRENLGTYLDRGNTLGFVKETGSDDFLGWVLLSKQKPNERYLELLSDGEDKEFVAQQNELRTKPYCVKLIELSKAAYESEDYETNEDYRMNVAHRFSSLEEAESFLMPLGLLLENIKWPIDIGMP